MTALKVLNVLYKYDHDIPLSRPPAHHYSPVYHDKPGTCPQPDRDYYNRPGYSQSIYDTIPRGWKFKS